jgi:hypothetical protein
MAKYVWRRNRDVMTMAAMYVENVRGIVGVC